MRLSTHAAPRSRRALRLPAGAPVAEKAPAGYRPPYGNAALDAFAWHAVKYLDPRATLRADGELHAGCRPVRCDFLIESAPAGKARRIAVQVGWARSLRDHQRRRACDAALVAAGAVDAIYRIGGPDLPGVMDDALFLIATWERAGGAGSHVPDVFSARGRLNLARLASPAAAALTLTAAGAAALLPASAEPASHGVVPLAPLLLLRRFDRRFPAWWAPHVVASAGRLNSISHS